MKLDLRIAATGVGILVIAGAVVGGVALAAAPAGHHPSRPAAPVVSTTPAAQLVTSTAAPSSTAASHTRTATVTRKPVHVIPRRTAAPKEQPVTSQASEPVQSQPSSTQLPSVPTNAGPQGGAPAPPQPSEAPVTVPNGYSGAADPTGTPTD